MSLMYIYNLHCIILKQITIHFIAIIYNIYFMYLQKKNNDNNLFYFIFLQYYYVLNNCGFCLRTKCLEIFSNLSTYYLTFLSTKIVFYHSMKKYVNGSIFWCTTWFTQIVLGKIFAF